MAEKENAVSSNSTQLIDREFAAPQIEGVDFGTKLWVIARSPEAVLIWVFGHSWSVNGHRSYSEPHLMLLPDRTPNFMYRPDYKRLEVSGMSRLMVSKIGPVEPHIEEAFPGSLYGVRRAIRDRQTLLVDGGGNQLQPPNLWGQGYHDWKARGGGFIMIPEGETEHSICRHKLGWKPKEKK